MRWERPPGDAGGRGDGEKRKGYNSTRDRVSGDSVFKSSGPLGTVSGPI